MNILMTLKEDQYPRIIDDVAKCKLESLGKIIYRPDLSESTSEQELDFALKQLEIEIIVTCWGGPRLTANIISENPQLKYMCHLAGTVRKFVELEAIEAGLIVSNWGNIISRYVAEGTLMMILAALRQMTFYQMDMHVRKKWNRDIPYESLFEQRVGLMGFGVIAQELVALLRPFNCNISVFDPYCPEELFKKFEVKCVNNLEELFSENRIISIHAANTPETYHIIDRSLLSKMENGGFIINTARGELIDTNALVEELKNGRINAALDVFEPEPLDEESELRGLENCLLLPHLAGPTPDRLFEMGNLGVQNIENYINGREVINIISPEKYKLMT